MSDRIQNKVRPNRLINAVCFFLPALVVLAPFALDLLIDARFVPRAAMNVLADTKLIGFQLVVIFVAAWVIYQQEHLSDRVRSAAESVLLGYFIVALLLVAAVGLLFLLLSTVKSWPC